jgi:hypothetical protein
MATRRYGLSQGEQNQAGNAVTEAVGAAIATDSMEFTFDLASSLTREDVIKGLERIKEHIMAGNFPPA